MKKILLVVLVVFLAFGQTLLMYFWQDDFALIFKLMHQSEPMGSFGSGIIGEGPYKYLVTPYVPFFVFFGTNPFGYFLIGFLTLLPVIFLFYKLSKGIFDDKRKAYLATLVFSSGYIGSDIMFRVINSWQTNIGLMLAILSLTFFVKYVRSNKLKLYIFSFLFFYSATEFVYVRSHSLVICFLIISLVFLKKLNFRQIVKVVVVQTPFWFLFFIKYLKDVPAGQSGLKIFVHEISSFNFEYLAGLFGTVGNAIFPDYYQSRLMSLFSANYNLVTLIIFCLIGFLIGKVSKLKVFQQVILIIILPVIYLINKGVFSKQVYWYNNESSFLSVSIGLYASFIFLASALFLWQRSKQVAVGIVIGYLFLVSQFFGYYIDYSTTIFSTTHRYLSYSAFGYALLMISLFGIFEKVNKKVYLILVSLLIISNLILGITYQSKLVKDRSMATKKFYEDLIKFQPNVKENAIFYFDLQENGFVKGQFRDFFSVGSMPDSTALAIWYGLDRDDIHFVTDYDEFLYTLNQYKDINNVYSFYYEKNGLVDTTNQMRNALSTGSSFFGTFNKFTIKGDLDFSDLTPCTEKKIDDKVISALSYLKDKDNYYKNVTTESSSEWRGQERTLATDNNLSTSWRGHRIFWHDHGFESLILDLQKVENINKVIWINTNYMLTPTEYNILVSIDKSSWKTVKEVKNGIERKTGEVVTETFESDNARYVKIDFTGDLSDDSPAVSEIEVVKSTYTTEDIDVANTISINPLKYIDICTFKNNLNAISKYVDIMVEFDGNKGKKNEKIKLSELTKSNFSVVSNTGGTQIKNINLNMSGLPLSYKIEKYENKTLKFQDILDLNLIKNFSRN